MKKIALGILAVIVLAVAVFVWQIGRPTTQTYLVRKAIAIFTKTYGVEASISKIHIRFFNNIEIEQLLLGDKKADTLAYIHHLDLHIAWWSLLKKQLIVDELELEGTYVNLYRLKNETDFNYQFLLPTETKTPSNDTLPLWIQLSKLSLLNTHFKYTDEPGGQFLNASLNNFAVNIEQADLNTSHYTIQNLLLADADIQMVMHAPDSLTLAKLPIPPPSPPVEAEDSSGLKLLVKNVNIQSACFTYDDKTKPIAKHRGLDYAHVQISDFNGRLKDVYIADDTIATKVQDISFSDQSGFVVNSLSANVQYNPQQIDLTSLDFQTPQSCIEANIQVAYPSTDAFTTSPELVTLDMELPLLQLHTKDLHLIYPQFKDLNLLRPQDYVLNASLTLNGTLADLLLEDIMVQIGNNHLNATRIALLNPTNADKLQYNVQGLQVKSAYNALRAVFAPTIIPPQLEAFGNFSLNGNAKGNLSNTFVKLQLLSDAGEVDADVGLWLNQPMRYKGSVALKGFEVGKIAAIDSLIGQVSLRTVFDMSGTDLATLSGKADLDIDQAELMGYNYENTVANLIFDKNIINANLQLADKNADAHIEAVANLRNPIPEFSTKTLIKHLNTSALGLYKWDYIFGAAINADIKGNNLDDMSGTVQVADAHFTKNDTTLHLKLLDLAFDQSVGHHKTLELKSDVADLTITGNFQPTQVPSGIMRFVNRYYHAFPDTVPMNVPPQQLAFELHTKDISLLQKLYLPDLKGLDSSTIIGSLDEQKDTLLVEARLNNLKYGDYLIEQIDLNSDNKDGKIQTELNVVQLHIIKSDSTETVLPSIDLTAYISNDSLLLGAMVMTDTSTTALAISNLLIALEEEDILIELLGDEIVLNNNSWKIQPDNLVKIMPNGIVVKNFKLGYGNGLITINNKEEGNGLSPLQLQISDFDLKDISQLVGLDSLELSGLLNGEVEVANPMGDLKATAHVDLTELVYSGMKLGDVVLKTEYEKNGKIPIDLKISGGDLDGLLLGSYDLNQPDKALNLGLDIHRFDVSSLNHILEETVSDLKGILQGKVRIEGAIDAPKLSGGIELNISQAHLVMTNATYTMDKLQLRLEPTAITIEPTAIIDHTGSKLYLQGKMTHTNFENMGINFQANGNNLQLMNTKAAVEGMPVYGVVNGNLEVKVSGRDNNPDIRVFFETNKNTDVYVVIPESESDIERAELVVFGSQDAQIDAAMQKKAEKERIKLEENAKSAFKYNLTLKLTATNDARINIVIDPAAGDQITCSGEGDMTVETNETGNLLVAGDYTINEGYYQMTLQDVIKRRFNIERGSTLNFAGDPLSSRFNITAIYEVQTSVFEMVSEFSDQLSDTEISKLKRRQSVQVALSISGTIAAPKLTFNIILPQLQDEPNPLLERKLAQIRENDTELNKQSFGLIMFNRFIPASSAPTVATPDAESIIYSSLSKMVSDQLNNMAGKYVKGLEIMVNVEADGAGDTRSRELQYGVSQRLFNERVTIQIGGTVALNDQQQSSSGLAPDVAIEYNITKDGKVKARAFRKDRYHLLSQLYRPTTGIGITYKKKFGLFKELFKKQKK